MSYLVLCSWKQNSFMRGINKTCYPLVPEGENIIGLPSDKHFRNHLVSEPITHLKTSYLIKSYIRIFQGITFGT